VKKSCVSAGSNGYAPDFIRLRSTTCLIIQDPTFKKDFIGPQVIEFYEFIPRVDTAFPIPIIMRADENFVDPDPTGDPGWGGEG
jgi:hypothetical protein